MKSTTVVGRPSITPSNIGPMMSQISAKVSRVLPPIAAGCLVEPRIGPVAVVVELGVVAAPRDVHREAGLEQDAQRRAQALRPALDRSDRGPAPIDAAHQSAHLAAACENRNGIRRAAHRGSPCMSSDAMPSDVSPCGRLPRSRPGRPRSVLAASVTGLLSTDGIPISTGRSGSGPETNAPSADAAPHRPSVRRGARRPIGTGRPAR